MKNGSYKCKIHVGIGIAKVGKDQTDKAKGTYIQLWNFRGMV